MRALEAGSVRLAHGRLSCRRCVCRLRPAPGRAADLALLRLRSGLRRRSAEFRPAFATPPSSEASSSAYGCESALAPLDLVIDLRANAMRT
jgi:hypothetical protein